MKELAVVNIGTTYNSPWGQTLGLGQLVNMVLQGGIVIAGIIALFLFVLGGIGMIASAGSGDSKSAVNSKAAVTYGAIGFIIVVAAYFVIQVIEVIVGVNLITAPGLL